jgi:tetratricopeptide (TPR) repeat protein
MAAPIQFVKRDLVISEHIQSGGADIVVACDTLTFVGNGLLDSGFGRSATGEGKRAGDILIIAREIRSLRISAVGQKGGSGAAGDRGGRGRAGDDGTPGDDLECSGSRFGHREPTPGGPGQNGGPGGRGEDGKRGYRGGDGGSLKVFYFMSSIPLASSGQGWADYRGGDGGSGGDGGPGGFGGDAGEGGRGGSGGTCEFSMKDADGSKSFDDAPDGPSGQRGEQGPPGAPGPQGERGGQGSLEIRRYGSEDDFREAVSPYLPALGMRSIARGEAFYLMNRPQDARTHFEAALASASDAPMARVFLKRIDDGFNVWGEDPMSASLLIEERGDGLVLKDMARISQELDRIRVLLSEASAIAEYRERQVYDRETASRALQFEKRQVDDQLDRLRKRLGEAEVEIREMKARIERLESRMNDLGNRIVELARTLRSLPGQAAEIGGQLLGSVREMTSFIGVALTAFGQGQWSETVFSLLGALGAAQRGLQSVEALRQLGLGVQVEINRTQDELESSRQLIEELHARLRQIVSQRDEDLMRDASLAQTRAMLDGFDMAQDIDHLRSLQAVSIKVLWAMRKSIARQVHVIRRYIDLRLMRGDALDPMTPPGEIDSAFSYLHLLQIIDSISGTVLEGRVPDITTWKADIGDPQVVESLNGAGGRVADFAIRSIPRFLAEARIRGVAVEAYDSEGQPVRGYFRLRQSASKLKTRSGAQFTMVGESQLLQSADGNAPAEWGVKFALRSPSALWSLEVLDVAADRSGNAPRIARFALAFKLEVSAEALSGG